jgi:hypothetical protein
MVARRILLPTTALAVAVIVGVAVATMANPQLPLSRSCDSLSITSRNYPFMENSFGYVCGRQSVSDGRLSITLNGYRFADGSSIDWQCPAAFHNGSSTSCSIPGFFLLVNATIQNVGSENASVGPTFQVSLSNTAGAPVKNGELGANASFSGHPDASIPIESGGVYLPPGAIASYWLIFNLPGVNQSDTPNLALQYLVLRELSYGGAWDGGGAFACGTCQKPDVQLIVTGTEEAQ